MESSRKIRELREKLINNLQDQYDLFIAKMKYKSLEELIERVHEIAIKDEIIECARSCSFSDSQLKILVGLSNSLDVIYQRWLKFDDDLWEKLEYVIQDTVEKEKKHLLKEIEETER